MNKQYKKGFTLAELLIVVAIIAVLVAVSIPIFTSQLEKSREATDAANIRAQYAVIMSDIILGEYDANNEYRVDLKQMNEGWQSFADVKSNTIYGLFDNIEGSPKQGGFATIHYNQPEEGKLLLKFDGGVSSIPAADYPDRANVMKDAIKDFFVNKKLTSGLTSWDSTYNSSHSGITTISDALKDINADEIKAWTVINSKAKKEGDRFPYGNNNILKQNSSESYFEESEKDLYYLWTAVDIKPQDMRGKEVPVMVSYTDNNGRVVYSVSNIKVTQGNDKGYNVISGYAPRPSNAEYNIDKHLENGRMDFSTSYDAAYAEYQKRLKEMGYSE